MPPRLETYLAEASAEHGTTPERVMSTSRLRRDCRARRDVMRRLRADGFSMPQIGDWMGRDPSTVFHAVEDGPRSPAPHHNLWSEAEDAILVARRAERVGFDAIAAEIGRSVQACESRMRRHVAAARAAEPQPVPEQVEDCTRALWRATDAWFRREASRRGMPIIETVMTILHGADVVARARAA
jgi:hypothetical protein